MTKEEIIEAVSNGQFVFWKTIDYAVVHNNGNPLIKCIRNGSCVGLTDMNGNLTESEDSFHIGSYVIGYHMSGYMPDEEPHITNTSHHAWECMKENLQNCIDSLVDEDVENATKQVEEYIQFVESKKSNIVYPSIRIGRYVYWIELSENPVEE